LVDPDGLSAAARDSEALWLSATLNLVLRIIADQLGHQLRPGDVIPTGAEAVRMGLLSHLSDSSPAPVGQALESLPCAEHIAVRRIHPSHLARASGLRTTLRGLIECAHNDAIGAIVIVLEASGLATSLADRWWSVVRSLGHTKPVVSYARLATSGGLLPLVSGTRAIANPLARIGAAGAVAYEVDRSSIPFWTSVQTPPGGVTARGSLQRRADIAAGLLNARIAEARSLDDAQRARVGQGALMTAREAYECGLVDRIGSISTAIEVARGLAQITR
jgi:ClpP class serine protease